LIRIHPWIVCALSNGNKRIPFASRIQAQAIRLSSQYSLLRYPVKTSKRLLDRTAIPPEVRRNANHFEDLISIFDESRAGHKRPALHAHCVGREIGAIAVDRHFLTLLRNPSLRCQRSHVCHGRRARRSFRRGQLQLRALLWIEREHRRARVLDMPVRRKSDLKLKHRMIEACTLREALLRARDATAEVLEGYTLADAGVSVAQLAAM